MKNVIFKGVVVDYTHDGKGIIKYEGIPIFVKDCLVNEEVEVRIVKDKKKYGFGRVEKIISASPNRVTPLCQYYQRCGGCQVQIMNEAEQAIFKKKKIINAFRMQKITLED
ncbi:MAG: TRAM domain-containing protein, partial [Bacilli bacterium]